MKKTFVASLFAAMFFAATHAFAQSVSMSYWSKYLGPNGAIYHDKPVLQTDFSGDLPRGFNWSIFYSAGLDDTKFSSNYGDEIDVTIGWSKELPRKLTLSTSIAYWDVVDLLSAKPADVVVGDMSLTAPVGEEGELTLNFQRFVSTDEAVFNGGSKVTLTLSLEKTLTDRLTASVHPSVAYDTGAFGYERAWVAGIEAALHWKVGKVTLTLPAVNSMAVLTNVDDGRKSETVWGAGLSFSF